MQTLTKFPISGTARCERTPVLHWPLPFNHQKQHRLNCGRCHATTAPSDGSSPRTRSAPKIRPSKEQTRRPPGRQAFTAADLATKSMQHSKWQERYGVVLAPPSRDSSLPQVCDGQAVVMVEGVNDAFVIREAVNAPVLIAGGTNSAKGAGGFARLQQVAEAVPTVVVLADPDAEGTRFRNWVSQQLAGEVLLHAFLPVSRAILSDKSKNHTLGNVGVEHAYARDVAKAISLANAREPGRSEFCREDLEEWEMVNGWDGAVVKHATLRREIVCNALGLGKMDGGKLVKALNVYGFSHEQVNKAVEFSQGRFAKVLPILLALKGMRKLESQAHLIDEMASPSVDAFAYALQKKVALAIAQELIKIEEASEFVCSCLEESGWTVTQEFRDAISELFQLNRAGGQ